MPIADSGAAEDEPEMPEPAPSEPAEDGEQMDGQGCERVPVVRPRVMFVLDKSSSMTDSGPERGAAAEDGGLSRWAQLRAVVGALADEMEGEAAMGAVLFPSTYAENEGFAELVAFARASLQIQTFVIGVAVTQGDATGPNDDPDAMLREIALAGGAAHGERGYFTMADALPLARALGSFVDRAEGESAVTTCR